MKNKNGIILLGTMGLNSCVNKKIAEFVKENNITIEKVQDPFAPEPFLITDPYRKHREEIQNVKYFEKPKSKFHK